jgi:hypothetical protein
MLPDGASGRAPAEDGRMQAANGNDSDIATGSIVAAVDSVIAQARQSGRRERAVPAQQGKGFPRGPQAQVPGFGRPVTLQGLTQIVGLALGAPEFQRR